MTNEAERHIVDWSLSSEIAFRDGYDWGLRAAPSPAPAAEDRQPIDLDALYLWFKEHAYDPRTFQLHTKAFIKDVLMDAFAMCDGSTPAPSADDARCDKCGKAHFEGDCKLDPTYADRHVVADQAQATPAPKSGLAAELDALDAYNDIEDQIGTDDEFASAEKPLLEMLQSTTKWTEETVALHESLICLLAALRNRGE